MILASWSFHPTRRPNGPSALFTVLATAAAVVAVGCGQGSSQRLPVLSGNTQVTLVLSSTANDQLVEFDLGIQGLTLTSQSGKTVNLVSASQAAEFIHINGGIEPLITVSVPQDVYTSATATIGGADFSCVELVPAMSILDTSTFAYGQTPSANVTVNLPAPITIRGDSMGLLLNLLVAQSAAYPACYVPNGLYTYSITPTFNLTPISISSQPTNSENGKVSGLNGEVSSIDAATNSFALTPPESENTWTITVVSGSGTAYQGISSFSDLAVGTFVDMDGAIQTDGSLLATRIAVEDPTATTVVTGPVLALVESESVFTFYGRQQQGFLYPNIHVIGSQDFSYGTAVFQISGQFTNLPNLPFVPSFDASTMVSGQNVYLSSSALTIGGGPLYVPVSTVTLIPQMIDGTVMDSSSSGGFSIYTVDLASYDLFPMLAVQPGQTTLLNNPSEVEVYVDSNTQQLNSQPLAAGSTLRFYGLVFNDQGTLRMDCAQINDGVSLTQTPGPSMSRMEKGQAKVLRSRSLGALRQTDRLITPAQ